MSKGKAKQSEWRESRRRARDEKKYRARDSERRIVCSFRVRERKTKSEREREKDEGTLQG